MSNGDFESEQRAQNLKTRKDAEVLQSLIAHPGWVVYSALIEAVGQNYYKTLMTPLEHALESTKSEYAKGSLNGLTLAVSLPAAKIAEANALRTSSDEE